MVLAETLAARFGALEALDLHGNDLGDADGAALAAAVPVPPGSCSVLLLQKLAVLRFTMKTTYKKTGVDTPENEPSKASWKEGLK